MDLYFSPVSAFSHKVLMAFFEKDVGFNPQIVDLTDATARAELAEVSPIGKVPCLKIGRNVVPESSSIIEWLDQHFQVNKLIPAKAEDARQVRHLDRMIDLYLTANAILLFFQSLKPAHLRDQPRQETAQRQMNYMLDELEKRLAAQSSEWLVADQLSLADLSLAAGLLPAAGLVDLHSYPSLQAYLARWQQRGSFARAHQGFDEALAGLIAAYTKGKAAEGVAEAQTERALVDG